MSMRNVSGAAENVQTVPIRMYEADDRIMIAAPLPGLEPENISVGIHADRVEIHGEKRGHEDRLPIVAEWSFGPYYREVRLPHAVDGSAANGTYGNGVLVLVLPKATAGTDAEFRLLVLSSTHGQRVGHSGGSVTATAVSPEKTGKVGKAASGIEPE
jgi:HSP20 family protein